MLKDKGNIRRQVNITAMRQNIIRMMTVAALLFVVITAGAQDNLAIGEAFRRFGTQKGCKMVTLVDGELKGKKLKLYKSLVYKRYGAEIESMVQTDRKRARKVQEVVVDGCVENGFYVLPPGAGGVNRFILFRRSSDVSGAVIYIEANLSPEEMRKIVIR